MNRITEAIETTAHSLALDTNDSTVAFLDTELHFADGTSEIYSGAVVRRTSQPPTGPPAAPKSIGDVIRAGLFEEFEDLKEYHIIDVVMPSEKREFKRRVKEKQRQLAGARLYQNVLNALFNDATRIGAEIDTEL